MKKKKEGENAAAAAVAKPGRSTSSSRPGQSQSGGQSGGQAKSKMSPVTAEEFYAMSQAKKWNWLRGRCWACGEDRHTKPGQDCVKRSHKCSRCGRVGHVPKVCLSDKPSGNANARQTEYVTDDEGDVLPLEYLPEQDVASANAVRRGPNIPTPKMPL